MGLFLQIVGGIVVGVFALILLLVLAWKLLKYRLLRHLQSTAADLRYTYVPTRLHLRAAKGVEWQHAEQVESLGRTLVDLGFADAGSFRVEELDYLRMRGFAHESQNVYAAVYEHDKAGVWYDLVSVYEDGSGLTHTNAPEGEHLDSRPGQTKVFDRTSSLTDLVRRHLAERRPGGLRPARVSEFATMLQQAYADTIDWRNARGGATEEELRRMAAAQGKELSAEELQQLREKQLNQAISGLDEALAETFLRTTTMTAAEWEEREGRLIYVYDLLPPAQVAERFYSATEPEEEAALPPDLAGLPARAAFARLNDRLPAERRMELAGQVSRPVEADVYVGPVVQDEDE